jgi:hypothetical protein
MKWNSQTIGACGYFAFPQDYKRVVNDPIANALHTIQLKLIPYDDEWNTGIVVKPEISEQGIDKKIGRYVRQVLNVEAAT